MPIVSQDAPETNVASPELDEPRSRRKTVRYIAMTGVYELYRTYDPGPDLDQVLAEELEDFRPGDDDVAIWHGERVVALIRGNGEAGPEAIRWEA